MTSLCIATVVKNGARSIERLNTSVCEFSRRINAHITHLIIDGCSTDATPYLVSMHKDNAAMIINLEVQHIIEPDSGIYDAMNKALDFVEAEWICFINSDDFISADNEFFDSINDALDDPSLCLILAPHTREQSRSVFLKEYPVYYPSLTLSQNFILGLKLLHTGFIVRSTLAKQSFFPLQYNISADFYWMSKCIVLLRGVHPSGIARLNFPYCVYSQGGFSGKPINRLITQVQLYSIAKEWSGFSVALFYIISRNIRALLVVSPFAWLRNFF